MIDYFQGKPASFSEILECSQRVVLFGGGEGGLEVLNYLNDRGVDVDFICDNDLTKQGTLLNDVRIVSPDILRNRSDTVVLISSIYYSEIALQLEQLGVSNYYSGFSYMWVGDTFNPELLLADRAMIEAASRFFDEESIELFAELINARYTLKPKIYPSPYNIYFHPLVKPLRGDTIIDGGAWIGDTALEFCRNINSDCTIYSFEPDEGNYQKLRETVVREELSNSVYPVMAGLWNYSTTLKFHVSDGNSTQCQVSENGSTEIPVVSIDEYATKHDLKINLIKMDIEGAEKEALIGAQNTIREFKPRLQISVYHRFDDLWKLPLLIKGFVSDYRFYLGHHTQNIYDTVLYAC